MAVYRTLVAALLGIAILAAPVSAQEEPSPSPEAELAPAGEVEELGGGWRRTPAGPFGAIELPGGWTGTEVIVTDPEDKRRAASYNPGLNVWDEAARPPWRISSGGEAHWTGTELVFVEPRGAAKRGLAAYDPLADSWRSTAPAPINEIASSAWADGNLVVISAVGRTAAYDAALDTWTELLPVPLPETAVDVPIQPVLSLHSTGEQVLVLTVADEVAFTPLELDDGGWGEASAGPLLTTSAGPLWIGDAFVFLTAADGDDSTLTEMATNARYAPGGDDWSVIENPCGIHTSGAFWTESHILASDQGRAFDPTTGQCYVVPVSPWAERTGVLPIWTGHELLELSGTTDGERPRRDGIAYDPFPGRDALGVAVNKPSRPVRVRVPSLGIDLPVIWDGRKVAGTSRGAVPCDVALTWSLFDLPGEPGTAWVLAHAQDGMFLPLLQTLNIEGKEALLGRTVELQLRDGRVFTYRTYRVNPRATNVNIGTKGRKDGEHRLVLQTSTGIGSAPKLLVAARLVDVGTTDERRPKPNPRACG